MKLADHPFLNVTYGLEVCDSCWLIEVTDMADADRSIREDEWEIIETLI